MKTSYWKLLMITLVINGCANDPENKNGDVALIAPAALQNGSISFPLVNYVVSSPDCDFLGECAMSGLHLGEDAVASENTSVFAPAYGVIRDATEHTYYGMVVLLDSNVDGEDVVFLMAHLSFSDRQVNIGDEVEQGRLLGYIGNSAENGGWSPHLHFGVHKGSFSSIPTYSCDGNWSYAGYSSAECVWGDWYDPSTFITMHSTDSHHNQDNPASGSELEDALYEMEHSDLHDLNPFAGYSDGTWLSSKLGNRDGAFHVWYGGGIEYAADGVPSDAWVQDYSGGSFCKFLSNFSSLKQRRRKKRVDNCFDLEQPA